MDALARRAVELGREHGYNAPDAAMQEVGQTLQTALGDHEIADLVRAGRLTQAVTYGGFGPTDLASALGASPPRKGARPSRRSPAPAEPAAQTGCRSSAEQLRRLPPRLGSRQRPPEGCGVSGGGGRGCHPARR